MNFDRWSFLIRYRNKTFLVLTFYSKQKQCSNYMGPLPLTLFYHPFSTCLKHGHQWATFYTLQSAFFIINQSRPLKWEPRIKGNEHDSSTGQRKRNICSWSRSVVLNVRCMSVSQWGERVKTVYTVVHKRSGVFCCIHSIVRWWC